LRDFSSLDAPGAEWAARAVADLNGDGHPDVIFVNKTTGQVDVYFYGGLQGTNFLSSETIGPLSATGWTVVGATDLNADGHPDLILQNPSTTTGPHPLSGRRERHNCHRDRGIERK